MQPINGAISAPNPSRGMAQQPSEPVMHALAQVLAQLDDIEIRSRGVVNRLRDGLSPNKAGEPMEAEDYSALPVGELLRRIADRCVCTSDSIHETHKTLFG